MPVPIKRSPTDLLQALAETVKKDPTAPNFACIDDPFTIPTSLVQKKLYLISKENGRRVARRLVEEWPTLFMFDRDYPQLAAFRPQKPLDPEVVDATEENLLQIISTNEVKNATKLYEQMKRADKKNEEGQRRIDKNTSISPDTMMKFFQMLCYYNGEDVPIQENPNYHATRKYFYPEIHTKIPETTQLWKGNKTHESLAEEIFKKLPKSAETYSLLICGMCKFPTEYSLKKARQLYQEMRAAGHVPFEEVFNYMIQREIPLGDAENFSPIDWIAEMNKCGVRPSVHTFNAFFDHLFMRKAENEQKMAPDPLPQSFDDETSEMVADSGTRKRDKDQSKEQRENDQQRQQELDFVLALISEMSRLGIEPNLGIYWRTLELLPQTIEARVNLFHEILSRLEQKLQSGGTIEYTDLEDQTFFYVGLGIAAQSQNELFLDWMVQIYEHEGNKVKIQNPSNEASFFANYLLPKLYFLPLDVFLVAYKKYVPNVMPLQVMLANNIFTEMRKRKPGEFCWPLLKQLIEDCISAHFIEIDKLASTVMHHLNDINPQLHLSSTDALEYLALSKRVIYAIENWEETKKRREEWRAIKREEAANKKQQQQQQEGGEQSASK